MHLHSQLILELVYIFGAATLVSTLFHRFHFPTLIGFILAGMFIGPGGLGLVESIGREASFFSEMGTVLLLFTIGLEISFSSLRKFFGAYFLLGMGQVVFTILLTAGIAKFLFGLPTSGAIFTGFLVSLSSTALLLKFLHQSNESQSPHGNTTVGILLFQDIAVIPMMLLLPSLSQSIQVGDIFQFEQLISFVVKLCAGLGFIWLGSKIIFPFILERVTRTASPEIFYFSILFSIFGVGYIAEHHGFSLSLGAFMAGVMISESSWGRQAMSEVMTMRDNFLGIFFIIIGMMINPMTIVHKPLLIFGLTILLFLIKFLVIFVLAKTLRFQHKVAFICALILAHVGEFSFLLIEEGRKLDLLSPDQHQTFLSVSVVSLLFAPWLYRYSSKLGNFSLFKKITFSKENYPQIDEELKSTPNLSEHHESVSNQPSQTIIIGHGIAGENLGNALADLDIPFSVIDMNHSVTKKNIVGAKQVIFGDASKAEILLDAGIRTAKLIVVTVSSPSMTQAIINNVQKVRTDINCIVRTQYLREAAQLDCRINLDMVVAEFETSLEILARALKVYGVATNKIHSFMEDTRSRFQKNHFDLNDSLRRIIEMPAWEAISSLAPIQISADSPFIGKSLQEVQLRARVGASIVAYYREGFGTQLPDGDFKLQQNDILHLLGSKASIDATPYYLQHGHLKDS